MYLLHGTWLQGTRHSCRILPLGSLDHRHYVFSSIIRSPSHSKNLWRCHEPLEAMKLVVNIIISPGNFPSVWATVLSLKLAVFKSLGNSTEPEAGSVHEALIIFHNFFYILFL